MLRSSENGQGRQVGPSSTNLFWKDQWGHYCNCWDTDHLWAPSSCPLASSHPLCTQQPPGPRWLTGWSVWEGQSLLLSSLTGSLFLQLGSVGLWPAQLGSQKGGHRRSLCFYMAQLWCQRWEAKSLSVAWLQFLFLISIAMSQKAEINASFCRQYSALSR